MSLRGMYYKSGPLQASEVDDFLVFARTESYACVQPVYKQATPAARSALVASVLQQDDVDLMVRLVRYVRTAKGFSAWVERVKPPASLMRMLAADNQSLAARSFELLPFDAQCAVVATTDVFRYDRRDVLFRWAEEQFPAGTLAEGSASGRAHAFSTVANVLRARLLDPGPPPSWFLVARLALLGYRVERQSLTASDDQLQQLGVLSEAERAEVDVLAGGLDTTLMQSERFDHPLFRQLRDLGVNLSLPQVHQPEGRRSVADTAEKAVALIVGQGPLREALRWMLAKDEWPRPEDDEEYARLVREGVMGSSMCSDRVSELLVAHYSGKTMGPLSGCAGHWRDRLGSAATVNIIRELIENTASRAALRSPTELPEEDSVELVWTTKQCAALDKLISNCPGRVAAAVRERLQAELDGDLAEFHVLADQWKGSLAELVAIIRAARQSGHDADCNGASGQAPDDGVARGAAAEAPAP